MTVLKNQVLAETIVEVNEILNKTSEYIYS